MSPVARLVVVRPTNSYGNGVAYRPKRRIRFSCVSAGHYFGVHVEISTIRPLHRFAPSPVENRVFKPSEQRHCSVSVECRTRVVYLAPVLWLAISFPYDQIHHHHLTIVSAAPGPSTQYEFCTAANLWYVSYNAILT